MSGRKRRSDHPDQLQLFVDGILELTCQDDLPDVPAAGADIDTEIRAVVKMMLREGNKTLDELAPKMSKLLGKKISVATLYSYTKKADPRPISCSIAHAFQVACGSSAVTEFFSKLLGGKHLPRSEVKKVKMVEVLEMEIRLRDLKKSLMRG